MMSQIPKERVEPGQYQKTFGELKCQLKRAKIFCMGAEKQVCLIRIKGVGGNIAKK